MDTYLGSSHGRMTLGNGDVIWWVSPTKAVSIRAKSGKSSDVVAVIEGSALPSTDLAITKTASVSQPVIGEQFFYNLSVKNNGPGLATGVVVTESLPPTVTLALAAPRQ